MEKQKIAVLFDMDGVLVDNQEYHFQSWLKFGEKYTISVDKENFLTFFGSSSKETIEGLFKKSVPDDQIKKYALEKEQIYRDLYRPHLKLLNGLKDFLLILKKKGIATAIATSAPLVNAEYVVKEASLENLFDEIVHDADFKRGKPEPEVYLIAAKKLNYAPSRCIVFEDSLQGIEAARRAGMKVIGVATTNTSEKISHTDKVIKDFTEITLEDLYKIMEITQ